MAVMVPTMTAEDLLRLPDDGYRYELVRGELKRMPPAGSEHGDCTMQLGWRLAQFVHANKLGKVFAAETGFLLSTNPDTVRAPDVAFVQKERVEQVGVVKGYWPGAPDLAAEVISPNDTYTEVSEKAMEWLAAGSRLVLILDPRRRTVTVYRSPHDIELLVEDESISLGEVVPGWSATVAEIFS